MTQFIEQAIYQEIGYKFPKTTTFFTSDKLIVRRENGVLSVGVRDKRDYLRAALIAKTNAACLSYEIVENGWFEDVCLMLDCSRNSVMTVEAVKRFMLNMEKMGYNLLQLYTEDTYEIDEPFFGILKSSL